MIAIVLKLGGQDGREFMSQVQDREKAGMVHLNSARVKETSN